MDIIEQRTKRELRAKPEVDVQQQRQQQQPRPPIDHAVPLADRVNQCRVLRLRNGQSASPLTYSLYHMLQDLGQRLKRMCGVGNRIQGTGYSLVCGLFPVSCCLSPIPQRCYNASSVLNYT